MCLTEMEGRDGHGVGLKVLPHITPSLSDNAYAPWQVEGPRYQS